MQAITPQVPAQVPFADQLPTPKALVNRAYDVAESLPAGQRRFAHGVLEAASPLFPGSGESAA